MECEMAKATEDVRAELVLGACICHAESPVEVLRGQTLLAGIVGHPAGHFCKCRGGGKRIFVAMGRVSAEQAWRDRALEIGRHCGVQMPSTDAAIGLTKDMHCAASDLRTS
jgi:hypothetical protein